MTRSCRRRSYGILAGVIWLVTAAALPVPAVTGQSGHHFASGSQRDNAYIGLDFGHNPFGGRSVSFGTTRGRSRLRDALTKAVEAGETRMSFDFGFDFRSVILLDGGNDYRLDTDVIPSIEVFLDEVERADEAARGQGRRFGADVVLTDYRIADGVSTERDAGSGDLVPIGEYPEFLTDAAARAALFAALRPALGLLGSHPRVTLNLMNEPEFISLPVSEVRARIDAGLWKAALIERPPVRSDRPYLTVRRDLAAGKIVLAQTHIPPDAAIGFLRDLHAVVMEAAPSARVTVGWADDLSALEQTSRLEATDGFRLVTDVISFHVYEAFGRGLTTEASTFAETFGSRPVRVTEWGLGQPDELEGALSSALNAAAERGFEGVLFWWDDAHAFSHDAFAAAIGAVGATPDAGGRTPDFDGNGAVDFLDFVAFASRFGTRPGDDGFSSRFDLDGDGAVGFGDFLVFAGAFGR